MMSDPELGPLIAIVGSDGSGKSTVGTLLVEWLRESRRAELCHVGKQTGDVGRALRRLPVVGGRVDAGLMKRAGSVRSAAGPDLLTALVSYRLSMRRVRRFRRMLKIRRSGALVVSDRYPQTAVLSPKLDGPHLAAVVPRNRLARALARRERAYYDWMVGFVPDLVIRLNVDLATAAARKPDHRYASLAAKVVMVTQLAFNGAPIVDIDTTQPLAVVLAEAKRAVAATLGMPAPA